MESLMLIASGIGCVGAVFAGIKWGLLAALLFVLVGAVLLGLAHLLSLLSDVLNRLARIDRQDQRAGIEEERL
jgi:hypothetical protein